MSYNHFHEIDRNPKTNRHLADIMDSIKTNGWQGLPLLADGDNLLNGCHRATACELLDISPEVHTIEFACTWGGDEYTDMLLADFSEACTTDQALRALKALRSEGLVDQLSVDILQAEYNNE